VNTYGESKLQFERIMKWYRIAHDLHHVSFRYFNACGATKAHGEHVGRVPHHPDSLRGGDRETAAFHALRLGLSNPRWNVRARLRPRLRHRDGPRPSPAKIDELKERDYNLGNGEGLTNLQVVNAVKEITGLDFEVVMADRRPGIRRPWSRAAKERVKN